MNMLRRLLIVIVVTAVAIMLSAGGASAEALRPWFRLSSVARPGNLPPGELGQISLTAINVGDAAADAQSEPIVLTDVLPEHVIPQKASIVEGTQNTGGTLPVLEKPCQVSEVRKVTCIFNAGALPPYHQVEILIPISIQEGATTGSLNHMRIAGGGAPSYETTHPLKISSDPTPFGVEDYEGTFEEPGGALITQAGSHPFQYTTIFNVNAGLVFDAEAPSKKAPAPIALAKDVTVKLPPGLIGNPIAYPRCSLHLFLTVHHAGANLCPLNTVVGVASATLFEPHIGGATGVLVRVVPIFNVEPGPGQAARFGFSPDGVPVFLGASVRTGEDYGVTARVENISQSVGFLTNTVTFWGVPGDERHNNARGAGCLEEIDRSEVPCEPDAKASSPPPFLTLPTACSGSPLATIADTDAWISPGTMVSPIPNPSVPMPTMDGCDLLGFHAGISAQPDTASASTASGLSVDVHVPQESSQAADGFEQSAIKTIEVTLPAGVTLNASAADGLQACTGEATSPLGGKMGVPVNEIGVTGDRQEFFSEPGVPHIGFTPRLPGSVLAGQAGEAEPLEPGVNFCPDAAKVGAVKITTPLLSNPLVGGVYLASPQNFRALPPQNPFQTHLAIYLVAEDPTTGVLVKLAGEIEVGGEPGVSGLAEGQVRTRFTNNPPVPFEDAEVHFFGGDRAALSTPPRCGRYTTEAAFEPWSNTSFDRQMLHASSQFAITSGPGGGPCAGEVLPFAPSMNADSTSVNAGAFTPLVTNINREDGQQRLGHVVVHLPPGASANLTGVPLCAESEANAGACSEASQIGESTASVGVGSHPFTVTGGKVYLTENYKGAPFGLSIVTPAKAGPFELQEGKPVVVRAKLEVDPITAAATVTSDEIPKEIEGIPLQIRHINVTVNRPNFTFNPTNCDPLSVTGTVFGREGAIAPVASPFQVTNCAALTFKPKLEVSTPGQASRANGASLRVKISYPKGSQGTASWFRYTKFVFPKGLSARLPTLNHACLAKTFESNEAACPSASRVGHVVVHTEVVPVPLEGPVYLVSYGNAKFPEAVFVLRGYGVMVQLHGETFVDPKTSRTSATFPNTPDVPFESIEVTLPQGPFSEFGANLPASANYNFCGRKLEMPTTLKAQNGLEIKQNAILALTGCKLGKTRAQKLAAALRACRKKRGKHKRTTCEAAARKSFSARR
jgi:hypothetical protein